MKRLRDISDEYKNAVYVSIMLSYIYVVNTIFW